MNKKLRAFNIEIDDIETINFENGMLQQIARKCAEEYDLKRLELVLNGNIITAKDKFTGINSYMGMRVSLEPLEKDISFIIRPTNKPTYDELEKENQELKKKYYERTECSGRLGNNKKVDQREKELEQLKEIEKEHQRINGDLRVEIKELKEKYMKLEDKYIHNVSCCNEEDCDLFCEHQELKLELSGYRQAILEDKDMLGLKEENQSLKKQLEENQNPLKGIFAQVNDDTLLRDCGNMNAEINELKNQQKEFIKYMNDISEDLETEDVYDEEMKGYLIQRIDTFKEILQKYRSIIGDKE